MMAIFSDMVKKFLKIFMDDFTMTWDSFDQCLADIRIFLHSPVVTDLVLKWKKCHFIYKQNSKWGTTKLCHDRKEVLAVIFAIDKFRQYLLGTKVIIWTDHSAILMTRMTRNRDLLDGFSCCKGLILKSRAARAAT